MRRATYHVEHEVSADHWWFRGRRRILTRLLADLGLPRSARILDAGCGTGANAPALAPHGQVFGVDASPVPLSLARKSHQMAHAHSSPSPPGTSRALANTAGIRFGRERPWETRVLRDRTPSGEICGLGDSARSVLARLERLPFASGSFDLVAALDLLEHLDDDQSGARELARVLAPGGRLLVFVPAFEQLWGLQDEVSDHRRRYTAHTLRSLLRRAGLTVQRLSYFNTALFLPILAARLTMRVVRPPVDTENNLTTPALNRIFGAIFGAEAPLLAHANLPIGVSLLAVAQR